VDFHEHLAALRRTGPVAWDEEIDAWVVTDYALVVEWMRNAQRFTVDDPRFSTGQILGPSMLSLDGDEHRRHRSPFAGAFGAAALRGHLTRRVEELAIERIDALRETRPNHTCDVRADIAGPYVADVMRIALGLDLVTSAELLGWYHDIVAAVSALSEGRQPDDDRYRVAVEQLGAAVRNALGRDDVLLNGPAEELSRDELVSNTAVCLFGGLETAEGMVVNSFAHILSYVDHQAILGDRDLLARAVDESLRLEPSVTRLDRFATADVSIGHADIKQGDMVVLSIAGANRDPKVFDNPHTYIPGRENANKHVTFAQGPHACIAMHLSRLEAVTMLHTAAQHLPGLRLSHPLSDSPTGTVFRKWNELQITWDH
jgi:cytochrome P450